MWVKRQDEDKFVISLYMKAWGQHAWDDVRNCFEAGYLYVVPSDPNEQPDSVDYTRCVLYDRYGMVPDWDPFPTEEETTYSYTHTTTPTTVERTDLYVKVN